MNYKKGIKNFFNSLSLQRIMELKRWNGFETIKEESVGGHSYIVTMLVTVIVNSMMEVSDNDAFKYQALNYAIFHDWDEFITGDVRHPVKYNNDYGEQIRELLKKIIEQGVEEQFPNDGHCPINKLIHESIIVKPRPDVKALVKLADWLSMYLFLDRENRMGNSVNNDALEYCRESTKVAVANLSSEMPLFHMDYNDDVLTDIIDFIKK